MTDESRARAANAGTNLAILRHIVIKFIEAGKDKQKRDKREKTEGSLEY